MPLSADALFARYQRTRDPQCLAQVFDALAPRLLRLAIHLARDGASAEDLVQATFLAAIERASEYDPARELESWLVGILSNKARLLRRDSMRRPDPERLREEAAIDPARAAQGAELSATVLEAIDSIEEPYRAVLLLHLVHGLDPAEIAHVLDRAPGTVRVQLHRAKNELRRRLPEGLTPPAFLLLPARGIDAVREAVLEQARIGAGVVGLLVMKKGIAVAGCLLLVLAAWRLVSGLRATPAEETRASTVRLAHAPDGGAEPGALTPAGPSAPGREAVQPVEPAGFLRGRVLDGQSGAPLAGARIGWYRLERDWTVADLIRARPDFVYQDLWGSAFSFASMPVVKLGNEDGERRPGETPLIWDLPQSSDSPAAEIRSAADGSFRLEVDPATWAIFAASSGKAREDVQLGTLQCRADGYGTTSVPLLFPSAEQAFRLWPERKLEGYVIDPNGTRLATPLRLLFYSTSSAGYSLASARKGHSLQDGALDIRGAGVSRVVETRANGSFELTIGAEGVQAHCRTPGWFLTGHGFNPEWKQDWVYSTSFTPGEEAEPIVLVAQPAPVLLVRDAESGQPIESFFLRLVIRSQLFGGSFFARGGRLQLQNRADEYTSIGRAIVAGTAWSTGYRFSDFEIPDLLAPGCTEVLLERGNEEPTRGRVQRAGLPVSATIGFQPRDPFGYRKERFRPLIELETEADGAFAVVLPPGPYLLRVSQGERTQLRPVELPRDAPLFVDLDQAASVVVEVKDSQGAPKVDHVVGLSEQPQGFSQCLFTDAGGRVEFTDLAAGTYRVQVPRVSTRGSFSGGLVQSLELALAETRRIEITLPARGEPRFARLVAETSVDFGGWSARIPYPETEWLAVEAGGRVPIDLQDVMSTLEVRSPDELGWRFDVPREAPDGYALHLQLAGPTYEGTVTDLEGRPWAKLQLQSFGAGVLASTLTDDLGAFRIPCEASTKVLMLNDEDPFRRRFLRFEPMRPPSTSGVTLRIRVPRLSSAGDFEGLANVRVSGIVRSLANGQPLAGARVWVLSQHADPTGTLLLGLGSSFSTAASDGRYTVLVPRGPSLRVDVTEAGNAKRLLSDTFVVSAEASDVERDLWVP